MAAYADKTLERKNQTAAARISGHAGAPAPFDDKRTEAAIQRQRQEYADNSPQATQLQAASSLMQPPIRRALPAQLTMIAGPRGEEIDVTEVPDGNVPVCLDSILGDVKFYRRTSGITKGWNDADLFYTKDGGSLVQVTIAMVNDHWDPRYPEFEQIDGPDWTMNCEDYAKAAGIGSKVGDFDGIDQLRPKIADNGHYVLKLANHWMRVQRTGDDAVTIRQKDGESAVYEKAFNSAKALEHIVGKASTGTVYHGP